MVDHPTHDDPALDSVVTWLRDATAPDPERLFGGAVRQSIDEVLDGPRTGRWGFEQLEKTEKTYVGTKIEIVVRSALELERGPVLDLEIEGVPVDLKWAMGSQWQIPIEALGEICLCVGGLKKMTQFQVGVVRCTEEHLNTGQNRDGKRTLSEAGRSAMVHLVDPSPLPPNFVAEMDLDLRAGIVDLPTMQARITALFQSLPYTAIPRTAVTTIARTTGDPMRRTRADSHAEDPLGDYSVLSAKYGNRLLEALGREPMDADHFMSVPKADIQALPASARGALPQAVRERFGLD